MFNIKRNTSVFFRSFRIALVLFLSVGLLLAGIGVCWSGIRRVGFGEERAPAAFEDGGIRILDAYADLSALEDSPLFSRLREAASSVYEFFSTIRLLTAKFFKV